MSSVTDGILWRLRSVRGGDGRTHLGFGACSHPYTPEIHDAFGWWVQLRHHDVLEATWQNLTSGVTNAARGTNPA